MYMLSHHVHHQQFISYSHYRTTDLLLIVLLLIVFLLIDPLLIVDCPSTIKKRGEATHKINWSQLDIVHTSLRTRKQRNRKQRNRGRIKKQIKRFDTDKNVCKRVLKMRKKSRKVQVRFRFSLNTPQWQSWPGLQRKQTKFSSWLLWCGLP